MITDVLAGLGFGIGVGWGILVLMVILHLRRRLRLNAQQERTALVHFAYIGFFSAVERITLSILSTPSNIENAQNLSVMIYVIPITARFFVGLAVWAAIRWVFFVFWPQARGS